MTRPFASEYVPITTGNLFEFDSINLSDWLLRIVRINGQSLISLTLENTNKTFTVDPYLSFEHKPNNRLPIFYNRGKLIEGDLLIFDNYEPQFKTFYNRNINKSIIIRFNEKCNCGNTLDQSNEMKNVYLCERFDCPFFICHECAHSENKFKHHCYQHYVQESMKVTDYVFKVDKKVGDVDVHIQNQVLSFNVNEILKSTAQRLTFICQKNNFYYDSVILNLHKTDGTIVPFVFTIFNNHSETPETLGKFLGQKFSSIHNQTYNKIIQQWNECWDIIFKNKNSKSFFMSFTSRETDDHIEQLPSDVSAITSAISQISSTVSRSDRSVRILPYRIINRMPYFNEIPILKYNEYLIFTECKDSVLNQLSKVHSVKVTKGNSLISCDLWSGSVKTDFCHLLTNHQNQRELWINGKLLMKDMKLIGYLYD